LEEGNERRIEQKRRKKGLNTEFTEIGHRDRREYWAVLTVGVGSTA
jgi:hypothetical protein